MKKREFGIAAVATVLLLALPVATAVVEYTKGQTPLQAAAEESPEALAEYDTGHDFAFTPVTPSEEAVPLNMADEASVEPVYDDKTSVYLSMLDAIDNYDYAKVTFETTMFGGVVTYTCETDMNTGYAYQKCINPEKGGLVMEDACNGENVILVDHVGDWYDPAYKTAVLRENVDAIAPEDRITVSDDGLPSYAYRENATNCFRASYCLYPQEIAYSYLKDFSMWEITGEEMYLDRNCVVINGTLCDYTATKHGISDFTMYVDKETGILMQLFGTNNGDEISLIKVTECSFQQPRAVVDHYAELLNAVQANAYTNIAEETVSE